MHPQASSPGQAQEPVKRLVFNNVDYVRSHAKVMGMSNLIPTVITDVNGKTTTVHRRAATGFPTIKKGIPAPGMPLAPKYVTRQAMKDLAAIGFKIIESPHGNKNLFYLAKRYPDLLAEVMTRVQNSKGGEREVWEHLVCNTEMHNANRSLPDHTRNEYRLWFTLLPAMVDLFSSKNGSLSNVHVIRNISRLAETIISLERQQQRFSEDDEYHRVAAIMTVIQINRFAGGTGKVEGRDNDIDFIAEHWTAVTEVIPELIQRKSADRGIVKQILSSKAPALNSGLL